MNELISMSKPNLVFPPPLKRGDTIGLFAPAGPVTDPQKLYDGIRVLENMGFKVKYSQEKWLQEGYLAATDNERALELHHLWDDNEVKALLAVRGGFGCLRMIDKLDLRFLQANPKMLIGFSDITVLLNVMAQQAEIVSFHGPVLTTLPTLDDRSLEIFFQILTGNLSMAYRFKETEILRPGTVSGQLAGGNLTTLVHLLATEYEPLWDNSILILEDTGESMYRLDRMFTQLRASGCLSKLNGLILGNFDCGLDTLENIRLQEQVWNRVLELTEEYALPVWGGFPIGHLQSNCMLPVGITASMNDYNGQLELEVPL